MADQDLTALYDTLLEFAAEQDSSRLLGRVASSAARLLNATMAGLYLYDGKKELVSSALHGCTTPPFGAQVPLGTTFPGIVALDREVVVLSAANDGDSFRPEWKDAGMAALIAAPIAHNGELAGIVFVADAQENTFGSTTVPVLQFLAAQAALCIHKLGLLEQVRAGRARVQFLTRRLLQAQEADAAQLGRQLQDEIGQALVGAEISLQLVQPEVTEPYAKAALERSRMTLERTIDQVREISLNLRPSMLDDFGLAPALRWLIQRYAKTQSFIVEFVGDALEPRPPIEIESTCFRVVQQVLGNLARRDFNGIVVIQLERSGVELQLRIEYAESNPNIDNPAPATGSPGFEGLQERALLVGGSFETAESETGTRLRACFPVTAQDAFVERRARGRNAA